MKQIIIIKTPQEVDSLKIKQAVTEAITAGFKSNEISLQMNFITDDKTLKVILDKFQILKNNAAFDRDIKSGKFKKATE